MQRNFRFPLYSKDENTTDEALNTLFVMYTHYLLYGHTIHSKSIKADTASKYLLAAATLLCNFDTIPGRDGRKKVPTDKGMCNEINIVLKEASRYEAVPDQQALRTK